MNKQKLKSIFKEHGFDITSEKGLFHNDFLDIKLNLRNHIYEPFNKVNATIKYISNKYNHPKTIRKYIYPMINQRLSHLTSDIQVFNHSFSLVRLMRH